MMPNIFYDCNKINFEHISFSDVFVRKKDYFLARAKYHKNAVWGIVSPNLKIIDVEELPDNYVEVTFSLPTNDLGAFANCINKLEEQCINHVYINSSQIYGKNKSMPIIYVNHNSSLKAQPGLIEFKVQINLSSDGTSFWTVGGTERMEQPTFDTLMKYCGRVAILFKLNGVNVYKNGKFSADWKVEQFLFKDPLDNDKKCLLRKRKTRRQRKPKRRTESDERVRTDLSERTSDNSTKEESEEEASNATEAEPEDADSEHTSDNWNRGNGTIGTTSDEQEESLSVDPDLDLDHVKEIPDRVVEYDFRKRLFLKGPSD